MGGAMKGYVGIAVPASNAAGCQDPVQTVASPTLCSSTVLSRLCVGHIPDSQRLRPGGSLCDRTGILI